MIEHAKEHASACAIAQLTLLEKTEPGASQFHTLMRVSCCLLKEVLEKRLQKRNRLLPQALKQETLREALIINSRVSFEHFPNFHESEKFPFERDVIASAPSTG